MATIGNLVIDILGSTEGLEKGLSKTEKLVGGVGGKLGALGKKAGAALGGLAVPGAAAVGTIGVTAFNVANDIDTASRQMQASLGLTTAEAETFGKLASEIYGNNFADSIGGAAEALTQTRQQLKNLSAVELKEATENALRLSDAYDEDLGGVLNATNTLMDQFGLSQQQAFDLITTGFQNGLNSSGDFLDSIGEYSNLFADTGLDAAEMFSLLETGLQGGVLGTDKIADAVKEFGIIANEGGEDVQAAFGTLGMDIEQIQASVASGQATWGDYLGEIITGLQGIEDPILRNQTQVALFGTMAEDLGTSFTDGLSTASTAIEDVTGATASLDAQYDTLGQKFEGLKRKAEVSLAPLGKLLVEGMEEAMPIVERGVAWFTETGVPKIEEFATKAGNWISEFITRSKPIIDEFSAKWDQTVAPAMVLVEDAIYRIKTALGLAETDVSGMDLALGSLKGILDAVIIAVQLGAVTMQGIAWAVEQVSEAIRIGLGLWDQMGQIVDRVGDRIPDWLRPGSPPPLYYALQDIGSAIRQMPDMGDAFAAPGPMPVPETDGLGMFQRPPADDPANGPGVVIERVVINANDEAGGQRAADGFVNQLRERGLVVACM